MKKSFSPFLLIGFLLGTLAFACHEPDPVETVGPLETDVGELGGEIGERSDACAQRYFNNFTVTFIPNQKSTCQCWNGWLNYTDTAGNVVKKPFVNTSNGMKQAGTTWNICVGSTAEVCFHKIAFSPYCDGTCFDFDNCKFTKNDAWAHGLTPCEVCRSTLNCTTDG